MPKLDEVKEKLGALKGLAEMFLGPKDVVGVDVGSYAVKVVLFKFEAGAWSLKAWGNLPSARRPTRAPTRRRPPSSISCAPSSSRRASRSRRSPPRSPATRSSSAT
ncbi:MAG: hypothetical protein M0D55_20010 [Elusimicrobiota bacterium]|nr:MAG: hypothetical protein M0D55_20010 [Elusimicrobiota bacterium]